MTKQPPAISGYEELISHSGHRLTPQRREVYDVLLAERLQGKIICDFDTARRIFTLVTALHWKG